MPDETQVMSDIVDPDIDPLIDSFLAEEEVTEDASEAGTQTETDPLEAELKQLGLNEPIPADIPLEARELIAKAIAKSNERVKGFQSGFDQARAELDAKARVYDQLNAMPEFQDWVEDMRSGTTGRPSAPAEPQLDLNNLPADPMDRLKYITKFLVAAELEERGIEKKLSTVGQAVGDIGWQGFVATHPDAPLFKADIDRLIRSGYGAEQAYRMAKGASVDEKAVEDRVLERVRARMTEKKKATGLGLPRDAGNTRPETTNKYAVYAEKHGNQAAIVKAIEDAQNAAGIRYDS